jgi:hypothetical protein
LNSSKETSTFLDFSGEEVRELKVNGKELKDAFKNKRIKIDLVKGKNEISSLFLNKYRNDGHGMHSFED